MSCLEPPEFRRVQVTFPPTGAAGGPAPCRSRFGPGSPDPPLQLQDDMHVPALLGPIYSGHVFGAYTDLGLWLKLQQI